MAAIPTVRVADNAKGAKKDATKVINASDYDESIHGPVLDTLPLADEAPPAKTEEAE